MRSYAAWLPNTVLMCLGWLALAAPAVGEPVVWVDERGVTHITDDRERVPAGAKAAASHEIEGLRDLWNDGISGPPVRSPEGAASQEERRIARLLRGAVADLQRGEAARAAAALRSILRLEPGRPEAHWYMALLERQRGRYGSAQSHLRAFLSGAGSDLQRWRDSAERRLAALDDELRLADPDPSRPDLELHALAGENFRIQLDAELARSNPDYAPKVLRYLEEARAQVAGQLGVVPREALGVVFYGKAAYQRAHAHRFSFQTVGFFDGRIHVASPAHPSGALRSLLFHEYAHAVFREQTGGDRPYRLNEGLAEQIERRSRRQPVSTRSERAALHQRIQAGAWIPLRRISASFAGLRDDDARAAYLQSILAAQWLERRTTREQRAGLLARLGQGHSADQALYQTLGVDTDGLDESLRRDIASEFPPTEASRPRRRPPTP